MAIFKQKDGTYKIQNAVTGWYIENSVPTLVFGKKGMNVELSILAGNTAATAYSYANEWMAGIRMMHYCLLLIFRQHTIPGQQGLWKIWFQVYLLHHVRIFIMMSS